MPREQSGLGYTSPSLEFDTVDVLGIPVARLDLAGVMSRIETCIATPEPHAFTLAYVNAHSCNLFFEDPAYRHAMLKTDLVYVDGNGARLAAFLSGDWLPPRMTGADWIYDLCELAARESYRLYFLGSPPGVAAAAAAKLCQHYPGLQVVAAHDGFFRLEDEQARIDELVRLKPDILLLGMSSPYQELWMDRLAPILSIPVIWAAGGVFDYASGYQRRAPRWMRHLWLEWLGRWLLEPKRLTRRYMVGVPQFLWRAITHAAQRRLARRRTA